MDVKTIGMVGAGSMGSGIAQVAAQSGYTVIMRDIDQKLVDRALASIDKFLTKSVEKGKMTADKKTEVLGRIKGTINLQDLKDVDYVIEGVNEDMELKKKVFKELDGLVRKDVIIASNTSSLSITEIANATERKDRIAGMHFFNPVPLMRLVEVIRSRFTSDETIAVAMDLSRKFGKEPIEVKTDVPCFVVNRLMMPHFIEAILLYEQGIASVEDIDKAAKLGLNYPMGPFELMDLTGIDIAYHVAEYLHKELNKELKWVAPRLMKDMVKAGKLGRKTGSGWYGDFNK